MRIKKFLSNNIKNISEVKRDIIEFYTFVVIESNLECRVKKINKKRIIWEVRYLGEKNEAHPQGKWQVKRGETVEKLIIYLKKKGRKRENEKPSEPNIYCEECHGRNGEHIL